MVEHMKAKFLCDYLKRQLEHTFPDGEAFSLTEFEKSIESSWEMIDNSFSGLSSKYYNGSAEDIFNYLNGDHYSMFLYLVSRNFYLLGNEKVASKVFLLNKMLHGIDVFYKVKMPDVFLFVHPLGTVLGNADYGENFCVYQGCTVGSKVGEYKYPSFGKNTILYSNSSVIGNCKIGDNTIFAADSSLISKNLDHGKMILNKYPENKLIDTKFEDFKGIFNL